MDDLFCQLPLQEPLPSQLHVYRSPKLLSEQLFAFSAQLTLFADKRRTRDDRKVTARLCANSLPIVFFATAGGPCRLLALTLLVVRTLLASYKPAWYTKTDRESNSDTSISEDAIPYGGALRAV